MKLFKSLGVTAAFNALIVSEFEFVGGLLLIAGVASRLTGFLLVTSMFVDYWAAGQATLPSVFFDSGKFHGTDPYTFLFASQLVLIVGAGFLSPNAAIATRWRNQA